MRIKNIGKEREGDERDGKERDGKERKSFLPYAFAVENIQHATQNPTSHEFPLLCDEMEVRI